MIIFLSDFCSTRPKKRVLWSLKVLMQKLTAHQFQQSVSGVLSQKFYLCHLYLQGSVRAYFKIGNERIRESPKWNSVFWTWEDHCTRLSKKCWYSSIDGQRDSWACNLDYGDTDRRYFFILQGGSLLLRDLAPYNLTILWRMVPILSIYIYRINCDWQKEEEKLEVCG